MSAECVDKQCLHLLTVRHSLQQGVRADCRPRAKIKAAGCLCLPLDRATRLPYFLKTQIL